MPEAGGTTTQSGVLYQNTVTGMYIGRMLGAALFGHPSSGNLIISVRSEAPSDVDDTVITFNDGRRIFIQAKEDVIKGSVPWNEMWANIAKQYRSTDFRRERDTIELWIGGLRSEHRDLREASKRAQGYTNESTKWWDALNINHRAQVQAIAALADFPTDNKAEIHAFFCHLNIECVPFDELEKLALRDMPSSNVTSHAILRLIRDRVGGHARYRITLNANDLIKSLATIDGIRFAGPISLSGDWFATRIELAKKHSYPRYTPDLRVGTPTADALEALGETDKWSERLALRLKSFAKLTGEWPTRVANDDDAWDAAFPEPLRSQGELLTPLLTSVAGQLQKWILSEADRQDVNRLIKAVDAAEDVAVSLRAVLVDDVDSIHGEGSSESQTFRQFQAEYECRFPTANIEALDRIRNALHEIRDWSTSQLPSLALAQAALLSGEAGSGKTHALCDIAEFRASRGLRTILLFGEWFSHAKTSAWEMIRSLLGFGAEVDSDRLFATLNAAGAASGYPLLICIDGLNETRPRGYWKSNLVLLIETFRKYSWLRLCVSCRTTYERTTIPSAALAELISIRHEGFAGIEFDACREFLDHYNLEPLGTPVFLPELRNPLFLRLICEAAVGKKLKSLPRGWHGIRTAVRAFLDAKNGQYEEEFGVDQRHKVPEKALSSFVAAAEAEQSPWLSFSKAASVIQNDTNPNDVNLLDWLVREGMLIADGVPHAQEESEDVVRIAFERLGDHLLTDRLLDPLNLTNLPGIFEPDGVLSFLIDNNSLSTEHAGIIEALAVQLPERFGTELPDVLSESIGSHETHTANLAFLSTISSRNPEKFTVRTGEILRNALSVRGIAEKAFDAAMTVASYPSSLDALHWLHPTLSAKTLVHRDGFWCGYLYQSYEGGRASRQLIESAFRLADNTIIVEEIAERWATALLWMCAAADRRIRDGATKAALRVTRDHPHLWGKLIRLFAETDDEYIFERCLAGAYGLLLNTRNLTAENSVAKEAFEAVFKNLLRFQNALIRDHARCILELADHDGVLPAHIDKVKFTPPYVSAWVLDTLTHDEAKRKYQSRRREMPRLYESCLNDDFFVYTLSCAYKYEQSFDRGAMGRWILQHVVDIGYLTDPRLAHYDGYIANHYGMLRGRPVWAERIGKKYQWIALARLMATLAANVPEEKDRYLPEYARPPLTYFAGRDLDPSVLIRTQGKRIVREKLWWQPLSYDFSADDVLRMEDWLSRQDDLPNTHQLLLPRKDLNGKSWTVLYTLSSWSERDDTDQDVEERYPYRTVWTHVRSYLVAADKREECWEWLSRQHFMGHWMPEGEQLHEGYVGEYPWATVFNEYPPDYYERQVDLGRVPISLCPTETSLSFSYSEDAVEDDNIRLAVPCRRFFKQTPSLRWDGEAGYQEGHKGPQRFVDPSLGTDRSSLLLVDTDWLQDFLFTNNLSLVWTAVGAKSVTTNNGHGGINEFSCAHLLESNGDIRTSEHVIERHDPRG